MAHSDFDESTAFNGKTFESTAENIAAEQLLLDVAESGEGPDEILRIWKPESHFVVLGRGGRIGDDVYLERCQAESIPVLRRISGGGTIVTGPGCLMYTVVLSLERRPGLRDVGFCHRFVGEKLQIAYQSCGYAVELRGHSDLCVGNRKFSGNAMRLGRNHVIYHGTLLVDFDLDLIPRYLKKPPRQPEYRNLRDHLEFVTNLMLDTTQLSEAIESVFNADRLSEYELDRSRIKSLVEERYAKDEWNFRI